MKPDLSVIIPAYNEARFIGRAIATLRRYACGLTLQVIVVDNGSRDGTRDIAAENGADVVLTERGTVAAIRNAGARLATADVLMFMDADVFPTAKWALHIREALGNAVSGKVLTGCWVSVPDECAWIERYWFKPLEHGRNTHINSGHMILSKRLFDDIGGFDPHLRTGEDFEFSMRAARLGAKILDDNRLRVIHEGYPKTLREFLRREVWHGIGDCQSLSAFLNSKIALLGFLVLHGQVGAWIASLVTGNPLPVIVAVILSLAVSAAASLHRYRSVGSATRVVTTGLYYLYFIARGLSPYMSWVGSARRRNAQGAKA